MNKLKAFFKKHGCTILFSLCGMTAIIFDDVILGILTGSCLISLAIIASREITLETTRNFNISLKGCDNQDAIRALIEGILEESTDAKMTKRSSLYEAPDKLEPKEA